MPLPDQEHTDQRNPQEVIEDSLKKIEGVDCVASNVLFSNHLRDVGTAIFNSFMDDRIDKTQFKEYAIRLVRLGERALDSENPILYAAAEEVHNGEGQARHLEYLRTNHVDSFIKVATMVGEMRNHLLNIKLAEEANK